MLSSLQNLAGTLLATLQTRLGLLANELQEQKLLLFQLLGLGVGLLFCAGLTLLLGLGLVLSVWWEQRVWVLGVSTAVFFTTALSCYLGLKRLLTAQDPLFGASLAALQDDVAMLRAAASQGRAHAGQRTESQAGE